MLGARMWVTGRVLVITLNKEGGKHVTDPFQKRAARQELIGSLSKVLVVIGVMLLKGIAHRLLI